MVDIYFMSLEHGVIAYRYSDIIPAHKDKITFSGTWLPEYTVLYRRFIYNEEKTIVYIFLKELP